MWSFYTRLVRGTDALSEEITLQNCFPFEKGPTLKGKKLARLASKFFPFRLDPFSEGD